ncbi:MAG: hypothetical protein GY711_30075 [bacterium]|nr:hypothetical protein [bacterium]
MFNRTPSCRVPIILGGSFAVLVTASLVAAVRVTLPPSINLQFKESPTADWLGSPPNGTKTTAQIRHSSDFETVGTWWTFDAYCYMEGSGVPVELQAPTPVAIGTVLDNSDGRYDNYPIMLSLPASYLTDFFDSVTSDGTSTQVYQSTVPTLNVGADIEPEPRIDFQYPRWSFATRMRWKEVLIAGPDAVDGAIHFHALAKQCIKRQLGVTNDWFTDPNNRLWDEVLEGTRGGWVEIQGLGVRDVNCDSLGYSTGDDFWGGVHPEGLISYTPEEPNISISETVYHNISGILPGFGNGPWSSYVTRPLFMGTLDGTACFEQQGLRSDGLVLVRNQSGGTTFFASVHRVTVREVCVQLSSGTWDVMGVKNQGESIQIFPPNQRPELHIP